MLYNQVFSFKLYPVLLLAAHNKAISFLCVQRGPVCTQKRGRIHSRSGNSYTVSGEKIYCYNKFEKNQCPDINYIQCASESCASHIQQLNLTCGKAVCGLQMVTDCFHLLLDSFFTLILPIIGGLNSHRCDKKASKTIWLNSWVCLRIYLAFWKICVQRVTNLVALPVFLPTITQM